MLVSCLSALLLACYLFPASGIQVGAVNLTMPEVSTLLGSHSALPADSVAITIDTIPQATQDTCLADTATQKLINPEYQYLQRFYSALKNSGKSSVRVIHYGDSQIEGDRMTKNIRNAFQTRFGGGGVGIIPLHQTIGSMSLQQRLSINGIQQTAKQGPKRYMAYGPKSKRRENKVYGPMAQTAVMNDSLVKGSEEITLSVTSLVKDTTAYFNKIQIFREKDSIITFSKPHRNYVLRMQYKGDIYGISLETDTGVIVDNIPMRGCAGTIFTTVEPKQLRHYYQKTNTRLIILQYGGNVMPYTKTAANISNYKERLRKQIRYIKRLAPEADLLFVGPSDMHTTIDGVKTSYPILPQMDKALKDLAAEEEIAYWSLFEAMGGRGGMTRWVAQGLAGSDGVHFTRKGADKAGNMLAEWLMKGYDEVK